MPRGLDRGHTIRGPRLFSTGWLRGPPARSDVPLPFGFSQKSWVTALNKVTQDPSSWPLALTRTRVKIYHQFFKNVSSSVQIHLFEAFPEFQKKLISTPWQRFSQLRSEGQQHRSSGPGSRPAKVLCLPSSNHPRSTRRQLPSGESNARNASLCPAPQRGKLQSNFASRNILKTPDVWMGNIIFKEHFI